MSASILGCMKRVFNSTVEMLSKKYLGKEKVIKGDIGKVYMSKLQVPLYEFESSLYATVGKRPWSSEFLTSEILARG